MHPLSPFPVNPNSKIGRLIAFGGAAVAALVATFLANEAQVVFHLSLSRELLLGYLTPFTVGTFALAYKWLHNLGAQELAAAERLLHLPPSVVADIDKLVEKLVEAHLPTPPAPTPAPPATPPASPPAA